MKRIFTLLLSLFGVSGFAQDAPDSLVVQPPYTVIVDSALHHLDKSRVPHGILYDRVYPFAQLTELEEGDTISIGYFLQAFSELQRARYGEEPNDDSAFTYRNARNIITGENLSNRLPLLVLNARYATVDTTSVADGRLAFKDSALRDGSNPASPYIGHSITLPVIAQLEPVKTETAYELYLAPFAEFENAASAVASVSVRDLTTGNEFALLYPGETVPVLFDAEGDHLLEHTVTLKDGNTYKYYQWLKTTSGASYFDACSDDSVEILATVPFIGPTETNASAFGGIGHGEYRIFYSTQNNSCTKQLRKPIIIVDAWDPGDKRTISEFFDKDKSKLLYTNSNGGQSNLANVLRAKGYDVIILNFPKVALSTVTIYYFGIPYTFNFSRDGGVDYIERNGMILAELIKQVNQKLAQNGSTEKLVVVGPSMGGQISRYALRWMELNGQNHNTRLWLSFDSPHLGANIPLGFQTMLQGLAQVTESEGARDFYENQLRSPAAGEMLIHQTFPDFFNAFQYMLSGMLGQWGLGVQNCFNNQAPLRLHWRNTLANIGYPQNLRRIALVNGSYNGGEYQTPGGKMLNFKGKTVKTNIRMIEGEAFFMKNNASSLMCFVETRSAFKTWLALGLFTGGTFSDDFRISGGVSSVYGPLDGAPGGMYDVQGQYEAELKAKNLEYALGFIRFETSAMTHNICFIPTKSALDVKYPNTDWRSALNNYQLRCNNETPFHSYYVPPTNENHITLTSDNVAWLMQELDNDFKINMHAAPVRCQDITYQLTPGISFPNNVTWSIVSGNGVSIVSGNSSSVILRGTSNPQNGGQTIIEAKIYAGLCYPDVPYYTVRATIPAPQDVGYAISFGTLPGCYYEARVLPATTGNTYRWSDNGWNFSAASSVNTHIPSGSNGYVARFGANDPVWAIIQSNCVAGGTKTLQTNFTIQSPSGNDCAYRLSPNSGEAPTIDQIERTGGIEILPNPTTGDWLVHIYQPASQIQARLTNATGQTVYTVEETKDVLEQIVIPGTALSPGVYFLTLTVDGKVSNHRLMKQ